MSDRTATRTIRTDRDAVAALFWVAALAEAHPFTEIEQET
jgi:hypothetical protein